MRIAASQPCCRSSLQTSKPFLPGNMTSRIINSSSRLPPIFKPVGPSTAVSTWCPSAVSRSDTVRRRPGSSSTKRMRELMLLLRWEGRKFDDEGGSSARFALHVHGSAVSFHNLFYQVQAETGSVNLIAHGFSASKERIENVVLLLGRDARAPVLHANLDHGSAGAGCCTRE